jgi:hypothetical protein
MMMMFVVDRGVSRPSKRAGSANIRQRQPGDIGFGSATSQFPSRRTGTGNQKTRFASEADPVDGSNLITSETDNSSSVAAL